jgi:hypothetical protein
VSKFEFTLAAKPELLVSRQKHIPTTNIFFARIKTMGAARLELPPIQQTHLGLNITPNTGLAFIQPDLTKVGLALKRLNI